MLKRRRRDPRRRRLRRGIRWGAAIFVVILLLEFLVLPELDAASKKLYLIGRVDVVYLLAGVLLEAASLVAYAQLTRTVLPADGPPRSRVLQINMSTLALSHVMPGGTAPGAALGYRLLTQNDVSGPDAGFAIAMQGVGSAVVLNVIFWLALVVSLFFHGYNPLYSVAAGAGVVMMAIFAGVIVMLTRGRRWSLETVQGLAAKVPFLDADKLAEAVKRIAERLKALAEDRLLMRRAATWAAANWLLDAASLWVFILAFHKLLSPMDLLVSYGLANVLAVIPITPGGLGIVEGVLIPTLHGFGVSKPVATFAVLGYRLFNFWLPIPLGGASYVSLRFTSVGWRERISSVHEEIVEHPVPIVPPSPDGSRDGSGADGSEPTQDETAGVSSPDGDTRNSERASNTGPEPSNGVRKPLAGVRSFVKLLARSRDDPRHETI